MGLPPYGIGIRSDTSIARTLCVLVVFGILECFRQMSPGQAVWWRRFPHTREGPEVCPCSMWTESSRGFNFGEVLAIRMLSKRRTCSLLMAVWTDLRAHRTVVLSVHSQPDPMQGLPWGVARDGFLRVKPVEHLQPV